MADPLSTPLLVITNQGLAAASVATPVGPFVWIQGFRIGSGFGYQPQATDTNINGTLLYSGVPSTYKYIGDNTLDVICKIPADAGPFEFGEVAIDLVGGLMFAKAVFQTPQTKYSSLGTNVLSTYTFNCLIKLSQPVAIFKIDTLMAEPPMIWEVDFWSDIYPPALSANPDIPSILVRELDAYGNSSLVLQASDTRWSAGTNYHNIGQATVVAATSNSVTVAQSQLPNIVISPAEMRAYVVGQQDGYMRSCSSVTASGANLVFHYIDPLVLSPAAPVGSVISVLSNGSQDTLLTVVGDITGSAVIRGKSVTISVATDIANINSRTITHNTAGVYTDIVPPGVSFLYVDAGGAGGGGGGAGGGWNTPHVTNEEYRAGGGGGGGGVAQTTTGYAIPVVEGDSIEVTIGAKGVGGTSGSAPGGNGGQGGTGGATIIKKNGVTILTLAGGQGGGGGAGFGPPSNQTGAGAGGGPGGSAGTDGYFGGGGGNGASSPFGTGGGAGRGATGGGGGTGTGIPGGAAAGNSAGGGGGGGIYVETNTVDGGPGGDGSDGIYSAKW